jgi:rubrerythrin
MTTLIEQAVHLETKAEESYRNAAQATSDPSAGRILTLLADEEGQHAQMLLKMTDVSDIVFPDLIRAAKNWIRGVIEGGALAISPDEGLVDVLQRAMTLEQQTETFYRENAETVEDVSVSRLFTRLADTERTHFLLIGSLVEHFNRPSEWVESAEFGERDEY